MPHENNIAALAQSRDQVCAGPRICLRRSSDQQACGDGDQAEDAAHGSTTVDAECASGMTDRLLHDEFASADVSAAGCYTLQGGSHKGCFFSRHMSEICRSGRAASANDPASPGSRTLNT